MEFLDYIKMCQEDELGRPMTPSVEQPMPQPARSPMPPTNQPTRPPMNQPPQPARPPMNQQMCRGMLYRVESGDTLYSISRRFDLTVRELMQVNPFVNVYNLQIGEELCLPVAQGTTPDGARPYVVKRDDTLMSILRQNRITFEELARLNRSVAVLKVPAGTVLLIP